MLSTTLYGGPIETDEAVRKASTPLLLAVRKLGPNRVRHVGTPPQHSPEWSMARTVWSLDGKPHVRVQVLMKAAGLDFDFKSFGWGRGGAL